MQISDVSTGFSAVVSRRSQTPAGPVLQVQIGPGDIISNIPVVQDFINHQIHEGETHHAIDPLPALNSSTVKYGITVPVYLPTIAAPHLTISVDTYNGTAQVNVYEDATFTGGTALAKYNKNRNDSNAEDVATTGTTIKTGVTSTNGTLIDSFYVGAGTKASGSNGMRDEWVLKSDTIYRVDVIGMVNPTAAIVRFQYYADLGV